MLPTNPPKEPGYFLGGTIRILALREMTYTGEWCQVEVAECLSKSVGPGVWTERVVLRPANTSRHLYRRLSRRFSLDHGDASSVSSFVVCKTSLQVTGFEKVVYKLFENIVEGVLAVSPMSEEMAEVSRATLPRCADHSRSHFHLIE
jgi:hypothetical protein